MTNSTNNVTRIESLAVDVIVSKGAALRHAGFWAAVSPLAERSYRHGSDKEQWTGKGSTARPLRSCWLAAFTPVNGKLPSTAGARAFRALAAFVSEEQNKKGRDISPDGVDLFLSAAETIVAAILVPASKAKPTDTANKEKAAIDKAIETLKQAANNHLLTEEQIKAIGYIVPAAKVPAAKVPAAKVPAAKVPAAKAEPALA